MDINNNKWRDKTKITIILAYRICLTTINNAGPNTAFCQQLDITEESGENKIQIRSKIIDDFIVLINKLQVDNHEVILTIDENEDFKSRK